MIDLAEATKTPAHSSPRRSEAAGCRVAPLRYLVASAHRHIRGIYRIVSDSLVIHHDADDKISFEVEVIDPNTTVDRHILHRTNCYLAHRKPRARNLIGYL